MRQPATVQYLEWNAPMDHGTSFETESELLRLIDSKRHAQFEST
jgi:hypothetical protein